MAINSCIFYKCNFPFGRAHIQDLRNVNCNNCALQKAGGLGGIRDYEIEIEKPCVNLSCISTNRFWKIVFILILKYL